jgi:hypothetical protein
MTPGTNRQDWRAWIGLGALVVALLAAAGCGQRTYPVTLSFKLSDGSPLTAGFAAVQHDTAPAILGGGPIGADGTCRPVLRGQSAPGLPAGTYRVGVAGPTPEDFDAPPPPPLFDSSYTNPADSGLTFTVGSGSAEQASFSLNKPR